VLAHVVLDLLVNIRQRMWASGHERHDRHSVSHSARSGTLGESPARPSPDPLDADYRRYGAASLTHPELAFLRSIPLKEDEGYPGRRSSTQQRESNDQPDWDYCYFECSRVGTVATSLNIVALVISLAALAVSSFFAIRQIGTARSANQLPVMNDILGEIRSPQFRHQEELLWGQLPALGHDVAYSRLSHNLREAADNVCLTYLMLAYVVSLGIVDPKLAILPVHYRVVRTWDVVSPFVVQERKLRGYEFSFLNLLESFVKFIKCQDIQHIVKTLNKPFE